MSEYEIRLNTLLSSVKDVEGKGNPSREKSIFFGKIKSTLDDESMKLELHLIKSTGPIDNQSIDSDEQEEIL